MKSIITSLILIFLTSNIALASGTGMPDLGWLGRVIIFIFVIIPIFILFYVASRIFEDKTKINEENDHKDENNKNA